jgi:hypothetical protein
MMSKKRWTRRKAVISDAESLRECMQAAYKVYTPRLGGKILPPMLVDYKENPIYLCEEYKWLTNEKVKIVG